MPDIKQRLKLEEKISSRKILNSLIFLSLAVSIVATIVLVSDKIHYGASYHGLSPFWGLGLISFFVLSYCLNRYHSKLASLLFLAAYFLLNTYFAYRWGVELPTVIVFYLLLVVMAAILLGIKSGWIMAAMTISILFLGAILEDLKILTPNLYWRANPASAADKIPEALAIIIITLVCALYVKQIKQALKRAWNSEELLRQERDNLETTVSIRTEELKKTQLEQMTQLYRFAEFGRLAGGIFHDLVNPLTAISLNLQQIKEPVNPKLQSSQDHLKRALAATGKMGEFVTALKKQLTSEKQNITFSVNEEIKQVLILLNYSLIKSGLNCHFSPSGDFWLKGNPIKFNQIIFNLVANAIDSYRSKDKPYQDIKIKLKRHKNRLIISVTDYGSGISAETQSQIFNPFFSTKTDKGLGIGLSATKNIIEKDYHGALCCHSQIGIGTKFTVSLPINHEASK